MTPYTTGSEPSGIKVAEMKDTTNTVVRLYSGNDSNVSKCSIQDGMGRV
jgi:hypothetical protein